MIVAEILRRHMPTNPTTLGIFPKTIGKLLNEKKLKVPPSQRSYRWGVENVEELFKDIQGAIDDDQTDEYFLGSIISIESTGKIWIYDGQQRLATTMILIGAIRDFFVSEGDGDTASEIERDSLISKKRGSSHINAHFMLNAKDHTFFEHRILIREDQPDRIALAKPSKLRRDSHKKIEAAAIAAKEFVKTIVGKRNPSEAGVMLHKWLDFIEESLCVIWVQVATEKMAFIIFETMNDRGLKLSASDLLKNLLHSKTEDDRRDVIIQKWDSMCGVLETIAGEEENIVEYIRCFWVMKNGQTRTRILFDKIKDHVTNSNKAVNFATELETTVQDYAAIVLSSHEKLANYGGTVKAHVDTLKILGVTQLRPLLLAAFIQFNTAEFTKLIERCVAWSVRFLIAGEPSGTIEGYYARAAVEVWAKRHVKAKDVTSGMKLYVPTDSVFEATFATAEIRNAQIAKYYLQALQECKDDKSSPGYTPTLRGHITLEHILPTKPDAGWGHFTSDEQKAYVYRLGNLVLLESNANGKIGSKAYSLKKPVLDKETEYSLTKETGQHSQWRKEEIEARQLGLAALATKTWPIG